MARRMFDALLTLHSVSSSRMNIVGCIGWTEIVAVNIMGLFTVRPTTLPVYKVTFGHTV